MDIKRKTEIVEQSLRSLMEHDDADTVARCAALDRVQATLDAGRKAMIERAGDKAKALFGENAEKG